MTNNTSNNRIHSMDALRAIMMLLGLVLHSSETYTVGADPYWAKDPNATHLFQNYLNSIIHIFRMPAFFLIAGFFGSMLFYERGIRSMVRNRVARIVFPFAAFLFVLHPLIIKAVNYTANIFEVSLSKTLTTMTLLPTITYHLWFLYYLILITFFSIILSLVLRKMPNIARKISSLFEWFMGRRAVFISLFSIVIFIMLVWMWDTWAPTPLSFIPDIKLFLFYLLFYLLGWVLYKSKYLLQDMMRHDWFFMLLAVLIFTLKYIFKSDVGDIIYGALNAVIIWFFIFGFLGLFTRYANQHSARMRYISDASYWVYLIHLPLTLFFPGLIANIAMPAFFKFLTVLTVTTIICFVSYHYLVRATIIGQFLNGKKYSTSKSDTL